MAPLIKLVLGAEVGEGRSYCLDEDRVLFFFKDFLLGVLMMIGWEAGITVIECFGITETAGVGYFYLVMIDSEGVG